FRELGADEQLLLLARFQGAIARQHFQTLRRYLALHRAGSARGDPVEKKPILATALAEQFAALVRRGPGRLEQQQAVLGTGGVDATTIELARQTDVVPVRGVTAQRQFETVLPHSLAVTGALVAAQSREQGHN